MEPQSNPVYMGKLVYLNNAQAAYSFPFASILYQITIDTPQSTSLEMQSIGLARAVFTGGGS
jgi:hypothetical protein